MQSSWDAPVQHRPGHCRVRARVDRQEAVKFRRLRTPKDLPVRYREAHLGMAGLCAAMSHQQLAQAGRVAEDRRGQVRDHQGDAVGEG